MPEIHPMSIALLRHLFSKDILIYGFALWPDGNFMSIDAFTEVALEMNKEYDEHYVNLGYKPGGEAVIKGIASDIRTMYTVDLLGTDIDKLKLISAEDVNDSAREVLNKSWQYQIQWQYLCNHMLKINSL